MSLLRGVFYRAFYKRHGVAGIKTRVYCLLFRSRKRESEVTQKGLSGVGLVFLPEICYIQIVFWQFIWMIFINVSNTAVRRGFTAKLVCLLRIK